MQGAEKEGVSLGQAAERFLSQFTLEERQRAQLEVRRFLLWGGNDTPMANLTGADVGRYAGGLGQSGAGLAQHLTALRSFLAFAWQHRFTTANLAPTLRPRRGSSAAKVPTVGLSLDQPASLTPEGRQSLLAELEALRSQRPNIAAGLRHAMADKDFRENAPLDAMREQQARLEGRIRQLETILSRAEVTPTTKQENAAVRLGDAVVLRDLATGQAVRYIIVGPNEVDSRQGRISSESPVGRAVRGRAAGEEVAVEVPAGVRRFRIESVEQR